jgi:hypothetical protein
MLKVDKITLDNMEAGYPGIYADVLRFENALLPSCHHCGSDDTADVQCGLIGRTMSIACATTKFKLLPNGPKPGRYFCNSCREFFN